MSRYRDRCNKIVNSLLESNLSIIDENNNQYNFESFITNNIDNINDLLGITSRDYGFAVEINLIELYELEENSITCKKISGNEFSIEFQFNAKAEGHIGKFSVGSGILNIKIYMIYNIELSLITSIEIDSVKMSKPFDPVEVYNAECSFYDKFIR